MNSYKLERRLEDTDIPVMTFNDMPSVYTLSYVIGGRHPRAAALLRSSVEGRALSRDEVAVSTLRDYSLNGEPLLVDTGNDTFVFNTTLSVVECLIARGDTVRKVHADGRTRLSLELIGKTVEWFNETDSCSATDALDITKGIIALLDNE